MHTSVYKGVVFIEGDAPDCRKLAPVSIKLNGIISQSQLKSLDDVKEEMLSFVRNAEANAIVDFKYGQRSTFWSSIFGLDNVYWFGEGVIAELPKDKYEEFCK